MRRIFSVFLLSFMAMACSTEMDDKYRTANPYREFESAADLRQTISEISNIRDSRLRDSVLDLLWDSLVAHCKIPFTADSGAVFLYRGDAASVHFTGDFTQWKIVKEFEARKVKNTNLWVLMTTFLPTARLDYKIVLNKTSWILDSANCFIQPTGFNINSELRMPQWEPSRWVEPDSTVARGTLTEPKTIMSEQLGYELSYFVYIPNGFVQGMETPVVYITDGHEYQNPALGNVPTVVDNLIAHEVIKPVVLVFVDPRNPQNREENRRRSEYSGNEKFVNFLANELVPHVESQLNLTVSAENRAIMGTSLGGWTSLLAGLLMSDVFNMVAAQSPAIQEDLVRQYAKAEKLPLKIFVSCGTFFDGGDNAKLLRDVLIFKGYSIDFVEVNEGHSWGAWRNQIDAIMKSFFALPPKPKKAK